MVSDQWSVMPDELPHSRLDHVYVVVRFDEPVNPESWHEAVKILKVFNSHEAAEKEAARLRSINGPCKCTYEVHSAHSALES